MEDRGPSPGLSVSFDRKGNTHVFRLWGEAAVAETIEQLRRVYEEHNASARLNLLFLDTGLTRHLTRWDVVSLMDFAQRNRPECPGRTAMVGASDLSYGTFRMAEGAGGEFSRHIRTFRSAAEAEEWIAQGGEASQDVA